VQALCHRIAIIDKGRLVVEGTVEDISDHLRIMPRLWVLASRVDQDTVSALRSIKGVEDVSVDDEALLVTCETEARMSVMAVLLERGVAVNDFKTIDPSLEEAFVRLLTEKEGS
jgi:ABC-2 type transport system ATP-binding protein